MKKLMILLLASILLISCETKQKIEQKWLETSMDMVAPYHKMDPYQAKVFDARTVTPGQAILLVASKSPWDSTRTLRARVFLVKKTGKEYKIGFALEKLKDTCFVHVSRFGIGSINPFSKKPNVVTGRCAPDGKVISFNVGKDFIVPLKEDPSIQEVVRKEVKGFAIFL